MNFQLIRPERLANWVSPTVERPPALEEFNYSAIAIEEDGKYFYWAKGISLEIERYEYEAIKANPKLYYFSTALKLHIRIHNELIPKQEKFESKNFSSRGNYEDPTTYEVLERVRVMVNSNIERRRRLSDGKIYHFSYGYFSPEYSGLISENVYELMKDSVVFDVEDGWVIRRKTGEKLRKLSEGDER